MSNWWDYVTGRAHDPNDNANGGELGIDLRTPNNSPIYSPWSGTVTYTGMSPHTGGIVKILTYIPGYGVIYEYFLHLNSINVSRGQQIDAHTLLGLSGGLQPGAGGWPHVEYGLFRNPAYANTYWGFPTGSTLDPTQLIENMRKGIFGIGAGVGQGGPGGIGNPGGSPGGTPLGFPIPNPLDSLPWLKTIGDWITGTNSWFNAQRILKLVFGVALLLIAFIGIWNGSSVGQTVNGAVAKTAETAAIAA